MKDQVAAITSMYITTTCISDKESTAYSTKKAVQEGRKQVILISPEVCFVEQSGEGCSALMSTNII